MTSTLHSIALPAFIFEQPALSVLLPVVAGTAVGALTRPERTKQTYHALKQPPLHPPAWVFGPVWTCLYAAMGYAAYRAWSIGNAPSLHARPQQLAKTGAGLYTLQLGLNLVWMPLFFAWKRPIEATVDILALTATTGSLAYTWGQIDPLSGWLLAPYLAWLSFATYLCAGCGYLNNWDFRKGKMDSKHN